MNIDTSKMPPRVRRIEPVVGTAWTPRRKPVSKTYFAKGKAVKKEFAQTLEEAVNERKDG